MSRLFRPFTGRELSRALFSLAVLALVSACAAKPQLSSQQEASNYLAHASRDYSAPGPASDPWGPYIVKAAARFDVPERWVREVIRQESGGRLYKNGELITSGAGAMGLMQVMPGTYDELRARYNLGDDAFHPLNNIMAGTAYVREMYDIYGSPGFLAAYNAGPGRLDDYLTRGRTLPDETRRYVAKIGPRIADAWPQRRSPAEDTMMAQLSLDIPSGPRYAARDSRYSRSEPTYAVARYTPPAPAPRYSTPTTAPVAYASNDAPRYSARPMATPVVATPEPPRYEAPRYSVARSDSRSDSRSEPPRSLTPPAQFAYAQAPQRPAGFSLVSQAAAEPIGTRRGGPTTGHWAIQVAALPNDRLAAAEANAAQGKARELLGGARVQVTSVRQGRETLYRARLGGLSRDAAQQACERLSRNRTGCMVVSPDAQS